MTKLIERSILSTPASHDPWVDADLLTEGTPLIRPKHPSVAFDAVLRASVIGSQRYWVEGSNEHPGTTAVAELRDWLDVPLDSIVSLVGLGPSTRAFWRNNPDAPIRNSGTKRLLRFRTAVGLLVGGLGRDQARLRLNATGWLDRVSDMIGVAAFEAWVHHELQPEPLEAPAHLSALTRQQLEALAVVPEGEFQRQDSERPRLTTEGSVGAEAD